MEPATFYSNVNPSPPSAPLQAATAVYSAACLNLWAQSRMQNGESCAQAAAEVCEGCEGRPEGRPVLFAGSLRDRIGGCRHLWRWWSRVESGQHD